MIDNLLPIHTDDYDPRVSSAVMHPVYLDPERSTTKRRRLTPTAHQGSSLLSPTVGQPMPASTSAGMQYNNMSMSPASLFAGGIAASQRARDIPPATTSDIQSRDLYSCSQPMPTSAPLQQLKLNTSPCGWPTLAEQPAESSFQQFYTPSLEGYPLTYPQSAPTRRMYPAIKYSSSTSAPWSAPVQSAATRLPIPASQSAYDILNDFNITYAPLLPQAQLQQPYAASLDLFPAGQHNTAPQLSSQPGLTREALEQLTAINGLRDGNMALLAPHPMSDRRRNKGPYICRKCNMQLKTFKEHERHRCTRFTCPFCHNTMSRKEYVVRHIKMHSCKNMTEEQREAWLAGRDRSSTTGGSSVGHRRQDDGEDEIARAAVAYQNAPVAPPWWTASSEAHTNTSFDISLQEDQAANAGGNDWLNVPFPMQLLDPRHS